ncbi:MAG: DUF2071 domain-containing protein [Gammaproteobacteria bacterium]
MIATPQTAAIENTSRLFAPTTMPRGEVSTHAELSHVSRIVYAVPSERVRRLLPASFDADDSVRPGREHSLISVTSFLDLGSRASGQDAFEQTSYRLHVTRAGKPASWLLGASVGSLSAIATRRMWHSPWHLGAMEFHALYNPAAGRYQEYQLRTQSQWANALWTIADTGEPLEVEGDPSSLRAVQASDSTDYFTRRDGSTGAQRIRIHNDGRPQFTRGRLLAAQCDLLERLGLLSRSELLQPVSIAMRQSMSCTFDMPQSDCRSIPQLYAVSRSSAGH